MQSLITYGLIGLVVTLLMNRLSGASGKEVQRDARGQTELRLNNLYRYLGYGGIAVAAAFLLLAAHYRDTEVYLITALVVTLFGGIGTLLLLHHRNHLLRFDDRWLTVHSWTGRQQQVAWRDVKRVTFNAVSGYILVEGSFKTLKIHHHLVGLNSFVGAVESNFGQPIGGMDLPFG